MEELRKLCGVRSVPEDFLLRILSSSTMKLTFRQTLWTFVLSDSPALTTLRTPSVPFRRPRDFAVLVLLLPGMSTPLGSLSSAVISWLAMMRSPIALYKSCFAEAKSAMVGDRWPPSPYSIKDERSADSVRLVNLATAFNVSYAINFPCL